MSQEHGGRHLRRPCVCLIRCDFFRFFPLWNEVKSIAALMKRHILWVHNTAGSHKLHKRWVAENTSSNNSRERGKRKDAHRNTSNNRAQGSGTLQKHSKRKQNSQQTRRKQNAGCNKDKSKCWSNRISSGEQWREERVKHKWQESE